MHLLNGIDCIDTSNEGRWYYVPNSKTNFTFSEKLEHKNEKSVTSINLELKLGELSINLSNPDKLKISNLKFTEAIVAEDDSEEGLQIVKIVKMT